MKERSAGNHWNERTIKMLCGASAYRKGEALFRAGKVELRRPEGAESGDYEAFVRDGDTLRVKLRLGGSDDAMAAECDCSAGFAFEQSCKHAAAALLQLLALRREGSLHGTGPSAAAEEAAGGESAPEVRADEAPARRDGYGRELPPLPRQGGGERDRRTESAERMGLSSEASEADGSEASGTEGPAEEAGDSGASARPAAGGGRRFAAASRPEDRLVGRVMDLFRQQPRALGGSRSIFESRRELTAEFLIAPYPHGPRRGLLGIELRVGPDRTYAVPDIREFLSRFERGESYSFSRHFAYDPAGDCFTAQDDAVLLRLDEIRRSEKMQRASAGALYTGEIGDPPSLPLPPHAWESLAPLLAAAPIAAIRSGGRATPGVGVSHEPLPLRFEFRRSASGGLRMSARGMAGTVALEAYGLALHRGRLYSLRPAEARRLADLQRIMRGGEANGRGAEEPDPEELEIPKAQMDAFMEQVAPGLMKLGDVFIASDVSERVLRIPLEARVYLDRVNDRLLAGLEFQYGDIVINPLERGGARRGESRILVREGEKELRILELMENAGFTRTESGYYMQGEEREFGFLHGVVPHLEKMARIYATTSVKERIIAVNPPPRISAGFNERSNWLEFRFELGGIPEAEIREVLAALREKRKYYRLRSGSLLPLDTAAFRSLLDFLNGIRPLLPEEGPDADGSFRLPAAAGLHLLDGRGEESGSGLIRPERELRRLLDSLRSPDLLDFPVPEPLESVLRDYQQTGYRWLKTLAHYRLGGVLADDMGLGKTVQSIAYLLSALPEIRQSGRPALIVAPASLMYNWRSELARFAPGIRAAVIDGSRREREAALIAAQSPEQASDVWIVSYPLLRRDSALYERIELHTLILDEAQAIKNPETQTAKSVKALRAGFRFALTGTPIENSLEELRSIFEAVLPGLYPGRRAFAELTRETVARRARPFLLRRLKSDVLRELPEKIESLRVSELLPEQKKLYAAHLAKLRFETLKHLDISEELGQSRILFLAGLTRLRQICCHPALFAEGYEGRSAKFEQLMETLEECRRAGRRVLVFSQFTQMLQLIGRELGVLGVPFFYLDGSTPARERPEMCERFNDGERDLFLISLKAGGTGLNLTGADTVILYDLWWNPAVERQAEDRAYRMGQRRDVQVIRLVAAGTIEEKMIALQRKKTQLIDEVIESGSGDVDLSLTAADIRELLGPES
ncbi:DEAD/DEAH box helicase [Saccharibacillus sp. CPCC 101409]|uniref:DEAD/DEAH box helicase n=1 Tax=Saccharibacillus sp. CPCC 101409 TaxID=3058041 RepID=UPI0026715F2C|nr:DEAD/DEAH box helicase [Saccharibacillus sp. CPCC 101409]MDO3408900.1 DEAD/DEAH box helicase [Saccharibacillus sp. CPCC 101409]